VRYELDGEFHEVASRLVVAADGRQSTVRRALGIRLNQVMSKATLGGLLVEAERWRDDASLGSSEGDVYYLAFPRPNGVVRLYLACEPGRMTAGPERGRNLLDTFRASAMPFAETLSSASIAGPCAYVRGSDAWTDGPVVEGVVLIGDAAGWSDPLIGCGLSVAFRDVRMVSEVLLGGDDWSPGAFEEYVNERAERMRRLKISGHLSTEIRCTFTPAGRQRRAAFRAELPSNPMTLHPFLSSATGPETAPAEAFDPANV
jgi:2-polyprenyl-6-methoxyphenol hydroxylase-like FAD-dependent oxidoreductase